MPRSRSLQGGGRLLTTTPTTLSSSTSTSLETSECNPENGPQSINAFPSSAVVKELYGINVIWLDQ